MATLYYQIQNFCPMSNWKCLIFCCLHSSRNKLLLYVLHQLFIFVLTYSKPVCLSAASLQSSKHTLAILVWNEANFGLICLWLLSLRTLYVTSSLLKGSMDLHLTLLLAVRFASIHVILFLASSAITLRLQDCFGRPLLLDPWPLLRTS